MNNLLLALLIILGIGLGVGYSQFTQTKPTATPPATDQSEAVETIPENTEVDSEETSKTTDVEADKTAIVKSSAPLREGELANSLAKIAIQEYEKGEETITGTVINEAGEPVEGVRITAVIRGLTPGVKAKKATEASLENYIVQEVHQYNYDQAMICRAHSNAEGEFTLEGILNEKEYELHAHSPDYCFEKSSRTLYKAGDEREFIALEYATVKVSVGDAEGETIGHGWVQLFNELENGKVQDRSFYQSWYSQEPTIRIPVNYKYFRFQASGRRFSEIEQQKLKANEKADLHFELMPKLGIYGKFTVGEGQVSDYIYLRVRKLEPGEDPDASDENSHTHTRHHSASDVDHSYNFNVEGPGRYLVQPVINHNSNLDYKIVDVHKGMTEINFDIPAVERSKYILATVEGPNGNSLSSCKFELSYESEHRSGSSGCRSMQQPDGIYLLAIPEDFLRHEKEATSSSKFEISLQCASPIYGTQSKSFAMNSSPTANFQFSEPAFVEVSINGIEDRMLRNLLSISLEQNGETATPQQKIGNQVLIQLGPLAPGAAKLRLYLQNESRWSSDSISFEELELSGGKNRVQLKIPRLHMLSVQFPAEHAGKSTRLNQVTHDDDGSHYNSSLSREIPQDGLVVFKYLREDEYYISIYGSDRMKIDLRADSTIDYAPMVINSIAVRVDDTSGLLYEWGLRSGDIIYGLDETEFENQNDTRLMFRIFSGNFNGELKVIRNGSRHIISLEVNETVDYKKLGGRLEPTSR